MMLSFAGRRCIQRVSTSYVRYNQTSAGSKLSLEEAQKKYRTSASDILATIPHDGEVSDSQHNELADLYTDYFERIGADTQEAIEEAKFRSSRLYTELVNLHQSKIIDVVQPFYANTHFPLLHQVSGNKNFTIDDFLDKYAEFLNIQKDERAEFDAAMKEGDPYPDDSAVLDLQTSYRQIIDECEDIHQDGIDALEMDFGSDNHNCDVKGFAPLLEDHPLPELYELEKQYAMSPEEVETWNFIEAMQKEIKEDPIEPMPEIPDIM